MRKQFFGFLVRWASTSFGLWLAGKILSGGSFSDSDATMTTFVVAGLLVSVINTVLKPLLVILALPAILLTLGLFMLVINGFTVYLALSLVPGIEVTFIGAFVAAMIISFINYLITGIIDYKVNYEEEN